jgi:hypothetical protein
MAWTSDQILTALAAEGAQRCVTYARLHTVTGLELRAIQNACGLLIKHGFITRTDQGCHRITDAGSAAVNASAPVRPGKHTPNPLRQRAWDALRMLQKTTLEEICLLSKEGGERDIESALGKYVRALDRAGYLQRLPIKAANGALRYRLVRNSGPQAPVWDAVIQVMRDPNTHEVHTCG